MSFQRTLICAAVTSAVLAAGGSRPAGSQVPPGAALPELRPMASFLSQLFITRVRGRIILKFPTAIANVGDGALEVNGSRSNLRGPMPAFQVLYGAQGRPVGQVPIGKFEYHATHRHWHLLSVAEYRLVRSTGGEVVRGSKVSFCLVDSFKVDRNFPGGVTGAQYRGCVRSKNARRIRSGISAGWVDFYGSDLPGQSLDLTGIPAGDYRLEVEVNPDGLLQEKSREDNIASVPVRLP